MNLTRYARLSALHGLDDWLSARELGRIACDEGVVADELQRDFALLLARELLGEGLFEVGDINENSFLPWSGSVGENMLRVARVILGDRTDGWGLGVYFRVTTTGAAVGADAKSSLSPRLWAWDDEPS